MSMVVIYVGILMKKLIVVNAAFTKICVVLPLLWLALVLRYFTKMSRVVIV